MASKAPKELKKNKPITNEAESYRRHKEKMAQKSRERSASGRDLGELPEVVSKKRKTRGKNDLNYFLQTYFKSKFSLAMSPDAVDAIKTIQQIAVSGGKMALAMPRGSGKTTILSLSALWAVLYGFSNYIVLIGANSTCASNILSEIKTELELNDKLLEDFPEACLPIRALEGSTAKANGQTIQGDRTRIKVSQDKIVLPSIPYLNICGGVIQCFGITGAIRGCVHTRIDGSSVRPDLVLLDDLLTEESAVSLQQNQKILKTINSSILGLAGAGKPISCFLCCTVLAKDDIADKLLNNELYPQWNGKRIPMLKSFPSNMELWEIYYEKVLEDARVHKNMIASNQFYKDNEQELLAGAEHYWEARKNPTDFSAIQNAMLLFFNDRDSFYSEYQNQPVIEDEKENGQISIEHVFEKIDNRNRFDIPTDAVNMIVHIDVQKTCLFYSIVAFSNNYNSYVVDYNVFPKQPTTYYSLPTLRITFDTLYPKLDINARVFQALSDLTTEIMERTYVNMNGDEITIDKILIDSAWGVTTDSVYQFCSQNIYKAITMPTRGLGIQANNKPISMYSAKKGEKIGQETIIKPTRTNRVRLFQYDTNYWKSFTRERILTPLGNNGCVHIFGNTRNIEHTRTYAEQLSSEFHVMTQGMGRTVEVWRTRPNRPDNHYFDNLVCCHAFASTLGISLGIEYNYKGTKRIVTNKRVKKVKKKLEFAE